jgi:hypothetical protein
LNIPHSYSSLDVPFALHVIERANMTEIDGSGADKFALPVPEFAFYGFVWLPSLPLCTVLSRRVAAPREQRIMTVEGFGLAGSTAWNDRVFVEKELLERLARRKFGDEILADKAFLYGLNALEANDWKRVREFQGRSSFRTYLARVAQHLLTDFARAEFGYKRPSKWVEAMGDLWEKVYRLLCLERRQPEEVMDRMRNPAAEKSRQDALAEAIAEHPDRPILQRDGSQARPSRRRFSPPGTHSALGTVGNGLWVFRLPEGMDGLALFRLLLDGTMGHPAQGLLRFRGTLQGTFLEAAAGNFEEGYSRLFRRKNQRGRHPNGRLRWNADLLANSKRTPRTEGPAATSPWRSKG